MRPQFQTGRGELIEAYLLDFEGDLYGQQLESTSSSACAASAASPRVDDLVEQMRRRRGRSRGRGRRATLPRRMPLTQERKAEITAQFGDNAQDTGNTRVQVALLTERINELTEHLRAHRRTTTRAAACSCSSASAGGCSATTRRRTSRATARSSASSACAGERHRARHAGARFTLKTEDGDAFTQDDLEGQTTVLVFYPFAFSPVCTDQFQIYEEVLDDFARRARDVRRLDCDATWAQKAFKEKLGISIPQLSDFEPKGEASRALGAYFEPGGMTNRAIVIFGPDGVVSWSYVADSPGDLPGVNLILDALALPPERSSTFRRRKSKIVSRSRRTSSRCASSPSGPNPIA